MDITMTINSKKDDEFSNRSKKTEANLRSDVIVDDFDRECASLENHADQWDREVEFAWFLILDQKGL